jgi:hypothetical protein
MKTFNDCEVCNSNEWDLIYNGEIRAGGGFLSKKWHSFKM